MASRDQESAAYEASLASRNYRAWLDEFIAPKVAVFDGEEEIPRHVLQDTAAAGFLCPTVAGPDAPGGLDTLHLGLLCEEVGRCSAALLSILTVQTMVAEVLTRWGTEQQKRRWLQRMGRGEVIAAFALSEPDVGSDARHVRTAAEPSRDGFVITGSKKWISAGAVADVFLTFAQTAKGPTAFLVERSEGLSVKPIRGMLGFRGAMLAEIDFDRVSVSPNALIGKAGFGFSHVAATALDIGRYCIAWGSVGLALACLEATTAYTEDRIQFGKRLIEHQLVARKVSNMVVGVRSARLMCVSAAQDRAVGSPEAPASTAMAKYYASRVVAKAASDAVQLHGANGCSADYPVARYLRDSKITEIIEGSSQILQTLFASVCRAGTGLAAARPYPRAVG